MKKIISICLFFLLINCSSLFSQSKNAAKQAGKVYHYSFEGQITSKDISVLEDKLILLPYTTLAKVKYKPDSQKGEIILNTRELAVTTESDSEFNLLALKQLLIATGLTPLNLQVTLLD